MSISSPTPVRCSPLVAEPLSSAQAADVSQVLKALADPIRLRLFSLIASHADGEACVCDLHDAFDLSQPTISHHLKVLHTAGLLDRERRGTWVFYLVRPAAMSALADLFSTTANGERPLAGADA